MKRLSFKDADEIADGFDPVDDIIADLDAEPIFNHDHQFEAVETVGPEIPAGVCPLREAFGVYAQMLGNEVADLDGNVFVYGPYFRYATGTDTHGLLRIAAHQRRQRSMQFCPSADPAQKFSECGIGVTNVVHPTEETE